MKIIQDWPPNIEKIKRVFDLSDTKPVFCWGNIIYNPHNLPLEMHIIVHEEVHEKQQEKIGVKKWWDKYLEDKDFRLSQEIPAYQAQYQFVMGIVKDRNKLARFLHLIASDLSGKLYGNMVQYNEAVQKIKNLAGNE